MTWELRFKLTELPETDPKFAKWPELMREAFDFVAPRTATFLKKYCGMKVEVEYLGLDEVTEHPL